ncbi:MAG TPA: hypothetical protein VFU93_00640 [Acidimicrobiales bacterium]|nr:hypothetical protein [Acidimicrobiales bacterium]
MDPRWRVRGRRAVVGGVLLAQAFFLVRGASADHADFAWRMFPEASDWRADITRDGEPVSDAEWGRLVRGRGLSRPSVRHHADAGVDNQLAFLRAALDWFATHDGDDGRVEATVTYWHNDDPPKTVVYRSEGR